MAISQPTATDRLNSPDHSLSHRVFANDPSSPVKAVTVDATGNVRIGDGGTTNYILASPTGLVDFFGDAGIRFPHASFSSSATQTIANTALAYAITFTDTEDAHGDITLSSSSHINIAIPGSYFLSFSAVGKSAAPNKLLDIWLAKDGVNVARSNTIAKFVGSANERIITVTFVLDVTATCYFELMMHSDDTGTTLTAAAAGTNPTRPACPSIILTVNMVSKLHA